MTSKCSNGRVAPTNTTKLRLFADSGGYCQNPKCLAEIFKHFEDKTIHIAEIAHIISAGDKGPRADTALSDEERSIYENLILLCPTCHTVIDKVDDKCPVDLILQWKTSHRNAIATAFGIMPFPSRNAAREAIVPLLSENKTIFDIYGPMTEERFNPESTMPRMWRRKIRTHVIPNNRKLLYLCDVNTSHFTHGERETVERFHQHVDDFEAKHINDSGGNGIQFPPEMENVFSSVNHDSN